MLEFTDQMCEEFHANRPLLRGGSLDEEPENNATRVRSSFHSRVPSVVQSEPPNVASRPFRSGREHRMLREGVIEMGI